MNENNTLTYTRPSCIPANQALHVAPEAGPWQTCSDQVMQDFLPDVMKNYHQLLVPLLEGGVKVIYDAIKWVFVSCVGDCYGCWRVIWLDGEISCVGGRFIPILKQPPPRIAGAGLRGRRGLHL